MRGVTALGGRGLKAIILSLSAMFFLYTVGSFIRNAAPYAKEVSETGFYPVHGYEAAPESLISPEVTTLSDEDHPASAKWHSEAMAKIKDKIGAWFPMDKMYGAVRPPWMDYGKSMESPSYHHAPPPPKEERSVIVGKISILNDPENEYIDRAVRTHTVHDKRHGYQHYIMREHSSSTANENFVAQMLSVLQAELSKPQSERLEWLYYFPATTIILNPNVPLELFLPPNHNSTLEERHLLFSNQTDVAGSPSPSLAHNVFAAKVHQWSVDLFTTLVARSQSHSKHASGTNSAEDITIPDILALPPPLSPDQHALTLPNHWLNAWPSTVPANAPPSAPTLAHTDPADPDDSDAAELPHQVRRGSFVLDLPLPPPNGTDAEESAAAAAAAAAASSPSNRWVDEDEDGDEDTQPEERDEGGNGDGSAVLARRFEHWLARAEARMPQWEAPLRETWYADEAREFWEGTAGVGGYVMATATLSSSPHPSHASASVVTSSAGSPVGYVELGYAPASARTSSSASAVGSSGRPGVDKLKEEVLALVREMEASVHNWRQEVSEEVRRATESRCGRARETIAEVELDGSDDEEEKMKKLQSVIGGLRKASSRFHRHTTHARHILLSSAQLTLANATNAISTAHSQIPSSIAISAHADTAPKEMKIRIETAVQTTLHLQSLIDRKDWNQDDVKAAVAAVEEAVAKVDERVKQVRDDERRAKEIGRLRQEEEKLARMEQLETERQRKEAEEGKVTLARLW